MDFSIENASYRAILDDLSDGILLLDNELKIHYSNRSFEKSYGLSATQIHGKKLSEMHAGITGTKLIQTCNEVLNSRQPAQFEEHISFNDLTWSIRIIPAAQGISIRFSKADKDDIYEASAMQSVINSIMFPFLMVDHDLTVMICNKHLKASYWQRVKKKIEVGQPYENFLLPGDHQQVVSCIKLALGGKASEKEISTGTNGSQEWFRAYFFPVQDHTDTITGAGVYYQDITRQKLVEKRISSSEHILRSTLESMPTSFAIIDSEYRIVYSSNTMQLNLYNAFGKLPQKGDSALEFVRDIDYPKFKEELDRALNGEIISQESAYHTYADDRLTWYYHYYYPIYNKKGQIKYTAFHAINIDQRKEALNQKEKMAEMYRLLMKATNDAVWDWDLINDHVLWNENIASLFGYDVNEVNNNITWWRNNLHEDDRERVLQSIDDCLNNGEKVWIQEYRFRCAGGEYRYVKDKGYVVFDDQHKAYRMIGSIQDIHEQKSHQLKLEQQNETLRQFAHTQSHVLRKPIANVLGLSNLINELLKAEQIDIIALIELVQMLETSAGEADMVIVDLVHKLHAAKSE